MRFKIENIRTLTLWLAFVWTSVSPLAIIAQPSSEELPAKFRQVSSLDEFVADGSYLVGAEYVVNANGQQNKGFCLLTNVNGSSTLQGVEVSRFSGSILEISDSRCIWKLQKEGSAYVLYSPSVQQGVALKKKSSTSLVMSAYDWEKWQLADVGDGMFILKSQTDNSRALGLNWYDVSKIYFGVYKTTGNNPTRLRIYKQLVNAVDLPGKAEMPADGSRVALMVKNQALVSNAETVNFKDVASYVLEDNTLAVASDFKSWICHREEPGAFRLTDDDGNGLETIIEQLPGQATWKVDNGYVVTTEIPERYLVQTENGSLDLMTKEEVIETNPDFGLFVSVGATPEFSIDEKGVKVLTGSWSARQLADVDWKDVQILDLTHLSLPKATVCFSQRPENNNAIVYVSADTKVSYLNTWNNVISCLADGTGKWKGQSVLVDRKSWYVDRDIKVGNGQLVYHRQAYADGKWETMILPFEASLPADFELAKLERRNENGDLIFKKVKDVVPNEPMLVRYVGTAADSKVNLSLSSKEGWLNPYQPSVVSFSGTYMPLNVTAEHNGIYLLNANGDTFVRAAAGSYLAPFRAAFFENTNRSIVRLAFEDELTGILQLKSDWIGKPCYTIDGQLVTKYLQTADLQRLPKGAYIIGGKKYLK